jgi:nucleoside-diphosphate-sugar epimerase
MREWRLKSRREQTMRIVVIGGTGHIGSHLTPMLFDACHDVVCVCRGSRQPYREHAAWKKIAYLYLDRGAEEKSGIFGAQIAQLEPEVVIDLTCYYPESAEQLVEALRARPAHLLHCGTIWVHGHSCTVPTTEDQPRQPFGGYGARKAAIEAWLLRQAAESAFPVTIIHPGHLVGQGWAPINPAGNFNLAIFAALKRGDEVAIPNFGMETVHHVHAEDVARAFLLALQNRSAATGQSFHAVSAAAITLRGYAESMAAWFRQQPRLRFLPWEEWKKLMPEKDAAVTEDHIRHSPNCSIQKARSLLEYEPRYSSLEAVQEAVTWLIENGVLA